MGNHSDIVVSETLSETTVKHFCTKRQREDAVSQPNECILNSFILTAIQLKKQVYNI